MTVETRFVVVRGGNEIMTFADKKAADEYDRMLDMADNIAQLLEDPALELTDKLREDLSIYLAQNREEVLIALLAKKRPSGSTGPNAKAFATDDDIDSDPTTVEKKKRVANKKA